MSLWADYLLERRGIETIETEKGFVSYYFSSPTVCHIEDMYVRPEYRTSGREAFSLFEQVKKRAQEGGAEFLTSQVVLGTKGAERALKLNLSRGFELYSAEAGVILMFMKINPQKGEE